MFDIKVLYNKIEEMKAYAKNFNSNCYLNNYKLQEIAEKPTTQMIILKHSAFILYDEQNFIRMYYWLPDIKTMNKIGEYLRKNRLERDIILELVGNVEVIFKKSDIFCEEGFKVYSILSRYRSESLILNKVTNSDVIYSVLKKDDVINILDILNDNLDPYESHLPDLTYLYDLQKKNLIYGAYTQNKLIGVLCLSNIGLRGIYSYQMAIKRNYQRQGIGRKLQHYALAHYNQCNNFIAWINDKNLVSQKLHVKLGYKKDGLKTLVLIYPANLT